MQLLLKACIFLPPTPWKSESGPQQIFHFRVQRHVYRQLLTHLPPSTSSSLLPILPTILSSERVVPLTAFPRPQVTFSVQPAKMNTPPPLSELLAGPRYSRPEEVTMCTEAAWRDDLNEVKRLAQWLLYDLRLPSDLTQPEPAWLFDSLLAAIKPARSEGCSRRSPGRGCCARALV